MKKISIAILVTTLFFVYLAPLNVTGDNIPPPEGPQCYDDDDCGVMWCNEEDGCHFDGVHFCHILHCGGSHCTNLRCVPWQTFEYSNCRCDTVHCFAECTGMLQNECGASYYYCDGDISCFEHSECNVESCTCYGGGGGGLPECVDCSLLSGCQGTFLKDFECDTFQNPENPEYLGCQEISSINCSLPENYDADEYDCNCDCGCYDIWESRETGECGGNDICLDGRDNDCDELADIEEEDCSIAPTALISCDSSGCGTPSCIGYTDCLVSLENLSTDPDIPDYREALIFEWDIVETPASPDYTCYEPESEPANFCDFIPANYLPVPSPGTRDFYNIELRAIDLSGKSSVDSIQYEHRAGALAEFECSEDGTNWSIQCEGLGIVRGGLVYLKDDLEPYYYVHSIPSYGASGITSRVWSINGEVFDNANNSEVSVPITNFNSVITLEITDSNNRTDEIGHLVPMVLNPPRWREVNPGRQIPD